MKYLIYLAALTIVSSCERNTYNKKYHDRKDERLANLITNEVALKIRQKYGLVPCGSGGQMMYRIEMLMLAFQCKHSLTEAEAREIIVASVEEFVSALNKNEEVRPYLGNYPCTEKNIEIEIYINDGKDNRMSTDQEFDIVTCRKGLIKYKSSKSHKYQLITLQEETFEEAKKILHTSPKGKDDILVI